MTQNGHWRFRRLGALVAVPAIGVLTLAACGGGSDSGSSGDGGAADSFTFAYPTASTNKTQWQAIAEKYQKETGVKIEQQALPNDSYGLTVRTQLQGGNAADVMVLSPGRGQDNAVLPLAEADYLEPLTDQASKDVIPAGSEQLFTIDDKIYAQPTDLVPVGLLWNSGAASDAGVEFPEDTDTMFDNCGSLAQDKKSFIALAGAAPPNVGLMALTISATRVYEETPDWNQQRADGDVTFADSEGWQDVLTTIVDMNDKGCFQPGAAGGGFDAITGGITQGTSLGAFAPSLAAAELMNSTPGLTIDVQPFPPASGQTPYMLASPNYALGVSAKSDGPQKKAGQEFLAWLADPAHSAEFTELSGGVPISGAEGATIPKQYEPVKDLLESGDYSPLPSLDWPNPSVYDSLSTGIQGLLTGQGDIKSVLEAVDKAWDNG
jgi:raffinose/stachyose/melibiose transport system substrate-binding protein